MSFHFDLNQMEWYKLFNRISNKMEGIMPVDDHHGDDPGVWI